MKQANKKLSEILNLTKIYPKTQNKNTLKKFKQSNTWCVKGKEKHTQQRKTRQCDKIKRKKESRVYKTIFFFQFKKMYVCMFFDLSEEKP